MAVLNYFPYAGQAQDTAGGMPEDWALQHIGLTERFFQRDISIAAGDDDGSTYCIMHSIPESAIITEMKIEADAMAAATSYSIGLYDPDSGAAIAANGYLNALDIHVGSTKNAPFDGMTALTHSQTAQRVWEVAGHTLLTKKGRYDLVLTANTAGTAAGVVTIRGRLINGG